MEKEENKGKLKIFTSYSHKDNESHVILECLLERKMTDRSIAIWNDNHIKPGEEWDKKIKDQLFASDIVIFLISEEFLKSEYIKRVEIEMTLNRHENGEVIILPIILSKCKFNESSLGKFEALPQKAKPISDWSESTLGWLDAIKKIDQTISDKLEISAIQSQASSNNINIIQSGDHNNNTGINNGTQNIQIT